MSKEIDKDKAWAEMSDAIKKYFAAAAYGTPDGEHDIYSGDYKEEIIENLVQEFSDTIFDATDGWIRFPYESAEIEDQSEGE